MPEKFHFARTQWYKADEADAEMKTAQDTIDGLKNEISELREAETRLIKHIDSLNDYIKLILNIKVQAVHTVSCLTEAISMLDGTPDPTHIRISETPRFKPANEEPTVAKDTNPESTTSDVIAKDTKPEPTQSGVKNNSLDSDVGKRLVQVIRHVLELDDDTEITEATTLDDDLMTDDIDRINLVLRIEDTFEFEILDSEFQPIKTVGEYLALINKKLETCGRTC